MVDVRRLFGEEYVNLDVRRWAAGDAEMVLDAVSLHSSQIIKNWLAYSLEVGACNPVITEDFRVL